MKSQNETIKSCISQYINACNVIIRMFEHKQELTFDGWVANRVGEVAVFGDYFFNFSDIVFDMESEALPGQIIEYYENSTEYSMNTLERKEVIKALKKETVKPFPNYRNWTLGAPKPTAKEMEKLKRAVNNARKLLEEEIINSKLKKQ